MLKSYSRPKYTDAYTQRKDKHILRTAHFHQWMIQILFLSTELQTNLSQLTSPQRWGTLDENITLSSAHPDSMNSVQKAELQNQDGTEEGVD